MKAVVKYVDHGKARQKTLNVERNEPNEILQAFLKEAKVPVYTYVRTIACGRYIYQWFDTADKALPHDVFGRIKYTRGVYEFHF